MASNGSDPFSPQPSGLQSMLARLRGMVQALKSPEPEELQGNELLPTWDEPVVAALAPGEPARREGMITESGEPSPGSAPADENTTPQPVEAEAIPGPETALTADSPAASPMQTDVGSSEPAEPPHPQAPLAAAQLCPYCQAPRASADTYCPNCGWIFPPPSEASQAPPSGEPAPLLKSRYQVGQRLADRGDVVRYRGVDLGMTGTEAVAVTIVRATLAQPVEAIASTEEAASHSGEQTGTDTLSAANPGDNGNATVASVPMEPTWPGIAWEASLLGKVASHAFPRQLDRFTDGDFEYLIEEVPLGQFLWDAWDDPDSTAERRFGWLVQIAQALEELHQHGAILEGLRPDIVVIDADGRAHLTDLADLLPLPVPTDLPVRATYYTAPELMLASADADARSDLYSFGAMLYALHLGRELTDLDFEMQGVPKSFIQRFPDAHPLFARLVSKTFSRELADRFPTEDAAHEDPTGFMELIRTLEISRRVLDDIRLEIAAWTTTGMVRTGNEDAFALLHAAESRENQMHDSALVLLADGMGGSEAGEIAASLAIQTMRKFLVQQRAFAHLSGLAGLHSDDPSQNSTPATAPVVETHKLLLAAALREANQAVHSASRNNPARRGMGCTAEAVYVDGRHVLVGHVGDSRTYHLHRGRLVQLTTDQTWVSRMVELGMLSAEEAEAHPRRNELQQAIGGYADIEPAVYHNPLVPGDWIVVCSDGLSNHIAPEPLKEMLLSSRSAESAARRLVNMVNFAGATDNATVVVIRVT